MFEGMGDTAVVTGAGRGIGLAFAKQLVAEGYDVVGTARNPNKYEFLSDEGVQALPLDVGSEDSIARFSTVLQDVVSSVDLLVNCAGINSMSNAPFTKESSLRLGELEQESLLNQLKVNTVGPILLVQELLPMLAEGARILNVSSWLGSISIKQTGGNYGYAASKAALNMMNRALAGDLKERGVLTVVMNPGWVRTNMGGDKAKLSPEESVAGMLKALRAATLDDSGGFLQWDGTEHPW
jgi:NAD(P)-dependent dehydrogenase (short-subunit alcohol dehydrogenase family)